MTVADPLPAVAGTDLSALAAAAQRALGGDALVILSLKGGMPAGLLATEGLTGEQRLRVHPVLASLTPDLGGGEVLTRPPPGAPSDGDAALLRHGYLGAVAAAAPLATGDAVAVVALWREPPAFENAELVRVFAIQAATALDQASRRRRPRSALHRLEALAALDGIVVAGTPLEGLCAALNTAVAPLFGATATGLMVWDDRRRLLRLLPGSFGADEATVAGSVISIEDFRSNSARVFSTGRGFVSNDTGRDRSLFQDQVDVFALRRVLSVPLMLAGRSVGVLHLADKPEDFTAEDLDRAEALAPKIATVLEIAQAHFRLRSQRRLEEVLSDVAVALASGERVREFLPAAFVALGEVAEASLLAYVPDDEPAILWRRGAVPEDVERTVLEEAQARPGVRAYVVGPRASGDPGWAAFHVPVLLGAQHVGTLAALRVRGEPFALDERHAIVRLANLAALARATERYQQQRAELARLHERQRIAEDLHDDVAQLLFAAQLSLDAALERGAEGSVADGIAQARGLLVRGDTAIRTVINRLSAPPPSADAALRLASAVTHIEQVFSRPIHLEVSEAAADAAHRLEGEAADALVQLARQVLLKAAGAEGPSEVSVELDRSGTGELVLEVRDDGVGVAGYRDTRDLTPLRRRFKDLGGAVRVRHPAAGGTRVTATLPL